ncbi:MAG: PfkB family carbohydrate kinase [Syntrophomonadaceae bacterium]
MNDEKLSIIGTGLICLDIIQSYNNTYYMAGGSCGNVLTALSFLGWEGTLIKNTYRDLAGRVINDDLNSIGVHCLEYGIPVDAPRIIQNIDIIDGLPKHKYLFQCPICGKTLPKLKPISEKDGQNILAGVHKPNVFYTDRSSKGINLLRNRLIQEGTWFFYEPNSCRNPKLVLENAAESHIIKFSSDRIPNSIAERIRNDAYNQNTVLIVRTEGSKGLSFCYKTRKKGEMSKWHHLDAISTPTIVDTAGAGDWCSAGILYVLVQKFPVYKNWLSYSDVVGALQFGQALSAISCGFLGAQGLIHSDATEVLEKLIDNHKDIIKPINKESTLLSPPKHEAFCEKCLMRIQ